MITIEIIYLNGMRCDTNEKRALYKSKNEKKINVFIMFLKKKLFNYIPPLTTKMTMTKKHNEEINEYKYIYIYI